MCVNKCLVFKWIVRVKLHTVKLFSNITNKWSTVNRIICMRLKLVKPFNYVQKHKLRHFLKRYPENMLRNHIFNIYLLEGYGIKLPTIVDMT